MSNKPTKKSDADKKWMRERRGPHRIIKPECHLVVSEGEKTEPLYFEAFASAVNRRFAGQGRHAADRIRFKVRGVGDNTLAVFEEAKRLASEWAREAGTPPAHVWVVYDKDDYADERFDEVARLCGSESDADTEYHALWSNQCIELWFLLHFEYLQSDIERARYCEKLDAHIRDRGLGNGSRKNKPDTFEMVFPFRENAMRNARRLMEMHGNAFPSRCAPGNPGVRAVRKTGLVLQGVGGRPAGTTTTAA